MYEKIQKPEQKKDSIKQQPDSILNIVARNKRKTDSRSHEKGNQKHTFNRNELQSENAKMETV